MTFHVPEKYRVKTGTLKSTEDYGNNGCFIIDSLRGACGRTPKSVRSVLNVYKHCFMKPLPL